MSARGERTRAKLIQATTDVVGQVGYARATTRAIADAAGVAEGTIYRHFHDKRQLFFAAVLERNAPILDWVSRLPELAGTSTVRANLSESLRQLARLRADVVPLELSLRADPDLAHALSEAGAAAPGAVPLEGPPGFIVAYLAAEQRLGRVRADVDTHQTAVIILATLFGLGMLPTTPGHDIDASLIDSTVDLLLTGIAPPQG